MTSICKQCRKAGRKLFLRGDRCYSQKCAMVKRPYNPGVHKTTGRRSVSEYGRQLAEKQNFKRIYRIRERQFKKYVEKSVKGKGDARENLIHILERRLDNVVFKLGFIKSRAAARQLVSHGNVLVNNRRIDVPSYQVKTGEVITLKEKIRKSRLMENLPIILKKYTPPTWLALDKEKIEGKVLSDPVIEDINLSEIGRIIEFYSR